MSSEIPDETKSTSHLTYDLAPLDLWLCHAAVLQCHQTSTVISDERLFRSFQHCRDPREFLAWLGFRRAKRPFQCDDPAPTLKIDKLGWPSADGRKKQLARHVQWRDGPRLQISQDRLDCFDGACAIGSDDSTRSALDP